VDIDSKCFRLSCIDHFDTLVTHQTPLLIRINFIKGKGYIESARLLNLLAFSILCLLVTWSQTIQAQPISNWRTVKLAINELPQPLDSLPIVSESLELFDHGTGKRLEPDWFFVLDNQLYLKEFSIAKELTEIDARFRVIPYDLQKRFTRIDTTSLRQSIDETAIGYTYDPFEKNESPIIQNAGLDYNGSFSRGISFGNNQSLTLNSAFNLQMAGTIGNDLEVVAAITDQNIPLQPEGNTQQLNEFDQIFIKLSKDQHTLIAGDYELTRPNSYFMNYFKKLQGATYQYQDELGKGTLNTQASVAVARGKFARNILQQIEGNQGPYKLQGREGERFIIVLAGTEKVFLDGQLLKRGIAEDYIIDYNRAEVSFTPRRLITKDSRIIVEFEYADQRYLRSLYALNSTWKTEKLEAYLNVYSEQDGLNSGSAQDLDSLSRVILREAGDNTETALGPGVDTVSATNELAVKYRWVDTIVTVPGGTAPFQILVYEAQPGENLFRASFIEVGTGNGDYVLAPEIAANGRVFQWIAPDSDTGLSRGNYRLGRQLVAPNQQQLYTAGIRYAFSEKTKVSAELGLSNVDLNRFSSEDDGDNAGGSIYLTLEDRRNLGKKKAGWDLESRGSYEMTQERFRSLNPYRPAEFRRDWNLSSDFTGNGIPEDANEHIGKVGMSLRKKGYGRFDVEGSTFIREGLYEGFRQKGRFLFSRSGWNIDLQGNWVQTDGANERTTFARPKVDISKSFQQLKNWKLGFYGEREKNSRYLPDSDTLQNNSFYYDLYRFYIQSPENKAFGLGAHYNRRFDFFPIAQNYVRNTTAPEVQVQGNWKQSNASRLDWTFTYRELMVNDPDLTTQTPQKTYLSRVQHQLNAFKGVLRSTTNYELSSGQEPRVEFNYLEIQAGEGVYQWRDFNSDGVQQINEFVVAPFQDSANYIRVSVFTDQFIRTDRVLLNQSVRLDPRTIWYNKKGIRKFMSRFSTQSTFRITRQTKEGDGVRPWDPFQFAIPDSSLVSVQSSIRNTLFFNRANPKHDLQLGQIENRRRIVSTIGFESRNNAEYFLRGRWNIIRSLSLEGQVSQGTEDSDSEFFDNQDYQLEHFELEPKITYLPSASFRSVLSYTHRQSENVAPDATEQARIHDFNLELTYNQSSATSLQVQTSFVSIDYTGTRNSPVEFAMLEGLQPGRNYLWSVLFNRRLSKNVRLSLNYEGRKTGSANVVHVGRAQVAATF